jgi:hypothetical protein
MILISHRGNTRGKGDQENNPDLLNSLIKRGQHIEIDVWLINDKLFLGHDKPEFMVTKNYLKNDLFWCHAKNLDALQYMLDNDIHCFWHQTDDFTITSKGFIWTFPNKPVTKNSIIVCQTLEETMLYYKMNIAGICSDFVGDLQ